MGPALASRGLRAPQAEILNKMEPPHLAGRPDVGDHSGFVMKQGTWSVYPRGGIWGQERQLGGTACLAPAEVEGVGWVASGVLGWWGADRGF